MSVITASVRPPRRRAALLALSLSLSFATVAAVGAEAAAAKPSSKPTKSTPPPTNASANVSPSVVTWGQAGNDMITITATGLTPGATYYEQVQSSSPAGAAITGAISFAATATGGVPAVDSTWEMNDPYRQGTPVPPTWSGPAQVVITSNNTANGMSLSSPPVATAPFTILPGQNTLIS